MGMKISLKEFQDMINNHETFVVNYGQGEYGDVKDLAIWDDSIKAYRDTTGIWGMELLFEIASGGIEGMSIERG